MTLLDLYNRIDWTVADTAAEAWAKNVGADEDITPERRRSARLAALEMAVNGPEKDQKRFGQYALGSEIMAQVVDIMGGNTKRG